MYVAATAILADSFDTRVLGTEQIWFGRKMDKI